MSKNFKRRYQAVATKDLSDLTPEQIKFINVLMHRGQKTTARRIFEKARDIIMSKKIEKNFSDFFEQAIYNASPIMEVRSKRIAGSAYQVPYEVKDHRRRALATRWIIGIARKKGGAPMEILLANELTAAYNNEGDAVKKKEEMHRMAEANRAFAHFARY